MDRLKMHSVNNIKENIEKIAELFPNVVTEVVKGYRTDGTVIVEHAVDFELLRQELSDAVADGPDERYQFTWPGKKKSILLANAPIAKTLRPCRTESVNFDTTENLYIEGDNLDALKLLQETYLGRVKMIYIDPPYNTGNDFIYDDDYAQDADEYLKNSGQYDSEGNRLVQNTESNGRFHTDWLNMMYPRLKVAKDLLKDDGVIFISIDDNELENLKKICNEVFGSNSFVTTIHVQMSTVQGQKVRAAKAGNIVKNGEYILVYSKNGIKSIGRRPLLDPVKYDNHYNRYLTETAKGRYCEEPLAELIERNKEITDELILLGLVKEPGRKISQTSFSEYYDLSPRFRKFINDNADRIARVHDSVDVPQHFRESMVNNEVYLYSVDKRDYLVCKNDSGLVTQRILLSEKLTHADDFYRTFGPTTIRGDWWSGFYLDMGNVSKEGGVNYNNGKKPVRLIKQMIDFVAGEDDIILDFFSGSATTAHAVMELNAEQNLNRKFILIQLNEDLDLSLQKAAGENKTDIQQTIRFLDSVNRPHFLSEIGKERICRAGAKILEMYPDAAGKLDTGFRVLRVDSTNMQEVYYQPAEYRQEQLDMFADNIKPDRTPEDLLFQVMLDLGVLLSSRIQETTISGKKVYDVADGFLIACFDTDINSQVITEIAKKKPYYAVFRDSGMASDSVAANFEQIFQVCSPSTIRKVL